MPYVPFGDCKLTHYLKDSIGGNCRTLVVACILSEEGQLNDTHLTCKFAEDLQQVRPACLYITIGMLMIAIRIRISLKVGDDKY